MRYGKTLWRLIGGASILLSLGGFPEAQTASVTALYGGGNQLMLLIDGAYLVTELLRYR